MTTLYWYPGCSTCKKSRKWLNDNGVTHEAVHLVEDTPDSATLDDLWQRAGSPPIKKLFNTAGKSYRSGGFKDRLPSMTDDDALAALAADGMLIKRPLLDLGDRVVIGFREAEWKTALAC